RRSRGVRGISRHGRAIALAATLLVVLAGAVGWSAVFQGRQAASPSSASAPTTSVAPTTLPPTTVAPTTEPPPTAPPATVPPTTQPTTAAPVTTAAAPAPAPAPPSGWGCGAALDYLRANAEPSFALECPGNAFGHQAMTCSYTAGYCPDG